MQIHFYKYQGTGNDFVVLDGRNPLPELTEEFIYRLCDRRFGVGADGLMVLMPDNQYDFRMLYFNADGLPGSMCGNGGRCLVKFALTQGFIKDHTRFIATDGEHKAICHADGTVSLLMSDVSGILGLDDGGVFLDTGSPHVVEWMSDVEELDVVAHGRTIRYSLAFKENGTNVNFVEATADGLFVRTYERGVEDETLSCGTGVTAAVLASVNAGKILAPENVVTVKTLGGDLKVSFEKSENGFKQVWLSGPAECVFEGNIEL